MLRQATVLHAQPTVVVRTELAPASYDRFDSLDAAASLGGAIVSVAAVVLVRTAKSAS
jgi:hypothetical protein